MLLIGIGSSARNEWGKKVELIITGFGLSNYYYLKPNRHAQIQAQMAEEKRLQRNRQLVDAYGDKDDLKDVEQALAVYEIQKSFWRINYLTLLLNNAEQPFQMSGALSSGTIYVLLRDRYEETLSQSRLALPLCWLYMTPSMVWHSHACRGAGTANQNSLNPLSVG